MTRNSLVAILRHARHPEVSKDPEQSVRISERAVEGRAQSARNA
jgi:hypothetical protein